MRVVDLARVAVDLVVLRVAAVLRVVFGFAAVLRVVRVAAACIFDARVPVVFAAPRPRVAVFFVIRIDERAPVVFGLARVVVFFIADARVPVVFGFARVVVARFGVDAARVVRLAVRAVVFAGARLVVERVPVARVVEVARRVRGMSPPALGSSQDTFPSGLFLPVSE